MDGDDPGLRDIVLQLTKTVLKLSDTLEKLAKKDSDDVPLIRAGEEEGWEIVRDTKKNEQKEILDSWKDELNNLLVFAGLFSAVVTSFTVESYAWLQQDPGDASNILLSHISLQLSAFTLGSTFVNSSSPALTLAEVGSSFIPVSYAVHVNTLWVLSLTLSLISAFFAIAVQQWLRQLRLPSEMPVRKVIQLLETRSDALQAWQIPSIISFLPLLLQIAVILFLVGLFFLLQALNTAVAVAFGVVALTALLVFLVTAVIPLLSFPCPYKSPIIPTAAILLQTMSYPLVLAITPIILCINYLSRRIPADFLLCIQGQPQWTISDLIWEYREFGTREEIPNDTGAVVRFILSAGAICEYDVVPYIKSFGRHMSVDMGQFWLLRELQDPVIDSHNSGRLEQTALASALLAVPSQSVPNVLPCLQSFDTWIHPDIMHHAILRSLRAVVPNFKGGDVLDGFGQLLPKMEPLTRRWLSDRHRRLLWVILCQRERTQDRRASWNDTELLMLFYQLGGTDFISSGQFVKHLLHICSKQQMTDVCYYQHAFPICLALDAILASHYEIDGHDADAISQLSSSIFDNTWNTNNYVCRIVFAAGALSLLSVQHTNVWDHSHECISTLATFVSRKEIAVRLRAMIQRHFDKPDRYPRHMSIVQIIGGVCRVSAAYSASHLTLGTTAHSLSRLSAALRDIWSVRKIEGGDQSEDDDSSEDKGPNDDRIVFNARKHLDELDRTIFELSCSPGWDLLNEAWDGYLVGLVVAEHAENTRMEYILETGMEALVIAERQPLQSTPPASYNSDGLPAVVLDITSDCANSTGAGACDLSLPLADTQGLDLCYFLEPTSAGDHGREGHNPRAARPHTRRYGSRNAFVVASAMPVPPQYVHTTRHQPS